MEKKRSKGVTIFGWWFIISGVFGILHLPKAIKIFTGATFLFFSILLCIATLICGIFILKLNSKARKIAILLCLIGIISIPVLFKPTFQYMKNNLDDGRYYARRRERILQELKPEYQKKAIEDLEKSKERVKNVLPILFMVMGIIPSLLLDLSMIYFLTRPKVKEQFSG